MGIYHWPVMPICDAQKLDVDPDDLLFMGVYRKCHTYKAGGGYDQFPEIWKRRFGSAPENIGDQFVVQLKGCPLHCPYCYVTEDGIYGQHINIPTYDLVRSFDLSKCGVFHLMGGAPALYLEHWPELLTLLEGRPFHSDFLLCEKPYDDYTLKEIAKFPNQLHAVSIKGEDVQAYKRNTGTDVDPRLILENLTKLVDYNIPFYITFTGMATEEIESFKEAMSYPFYTTDIFRDSFAIDVVDYKALHYKEKEEEAPL